jgi:hypothetical protein
MVIPGGVNMTSFDEALGGEDRNAELLRSTERERLTCDRWRILMTGIARCAQVVRPTPHHL